MSMKNYIDTFWNRTSDLPTVSKALELILESHLGLFYQLQNILPSYDGC